MSETVVLVQFTEQRCGPCFVL